MGGLHQADGCSHPSCQLLLHSCRCPVPYDHFALDSHAGYDMPILSVAVGGLVLVHEVHIDGIIRDLFIELGMQMTERLSVFLQAQDPHLRG